MNAIQIWPARMGNPARSAGFLSRGACDIMTAMDDAPAPPAPLRAERQRFFQADVFERPPQERPTHSTPEEIAEWLIGDARRAASAAATVDEFAWRMLAAGFPLLRVSIHAGTIHPQYLGVTIMWWRDTGRTVATLIAHEVAEVLLDAHNPVRRVTVLGETLRRRVDLPDDELDFPVLRDLKQRGATDYLALPVPSAHGPNYMVTYVTDRAGGFTDAEVQAMTEVSQRIAVVIDQHSQRRVAQNIVTAYLGATAGTKVLAGQIRRGTGEALRAVLWSSDLRAFTARSDRLVGERMIAILNELFEAQAHALHLHGGEILKFIGDGLLAIFPITTAVSATEAAHNALQAAQEALAAIRTLDEAPPMAGEPPLDVVVALHVGDVIYGNIGAPERLDFTVIGPAVNLVSRLEAMAKVMNLPIVVSDDFARAYGAHHMRSLGRHELRGLHTPHELFAPKLV